MTREDLEGMTVEELKQLKHALYEGAWEDGTIPACYQVGRELGRELSVFDGPKYRYEEGDLLIYVDDYGRYANVCWQGRLVLSTHTTEKLFVPGEWVERVRALKPEADRRRAEKRARFAEWQRERLLDLMAGKR